MLNIEQISPDNIAMLHVMAEENSVEYNFKKVVEELFEFGEAITKLETKHETNPKKPESNEAIKEFGDVIFRGVVYLMNIFPDQTVEEIQQRVNDHINYKLQKLEGYYEEKLYQGGL